MISWHLLSFESFANSERYKTAFLPRLLLCKFESFANSERYKTINTIARTTLPFESFANSERYKTAREKRKPMYGLRALLIQKDTKL